MPTDVFAPPTGANSPTIWIVGQDGSNDRFITNGTMPRISDDGRFLLFKRFLIPSSFNPFGIYPEFFVRELSSGQETRIIPPSFDEPSTSHFFSPASNQGNYEIVYDCGEFMCKVNRDGTNRFRFPWLNVEYSYDNFPAIRRGGDQLIAFSNNIITPNVGGLYTVNIDGTNRQKIPNTDCRDFNPAWSNDNQFIAFGTIYTACSNNYPSLGTYPYWISNLFKISPDGSARQQLTNFPLGTDCKQQNANCLTLGYVWTENNSKIIAAGRINGVKGLFAFNTDGSGSCLQIPISAGNAPDFVGGTVQTRIDQDVIAAGNGVTTGDNYTLVSTIGEPVAGLTSAGDVYSFESGFWAIPPDAVGSVTATPTSSATATVTPTLTPHSLRRRPPIMRSAGPSHTATRSAIRHRHDLFRMLRSPGMVLPPLLRQPVLRESWRASIHSRDLARVPIQSHPQNGRYERSNNIIRCREDSTACFRAAESAAHRQPTNSCRC